MSPHSRRAAARRLTAAVVAGALAAAGTAALTTPATATTTCDTATTWTGAGDGHSWTDAANWDAGVPDATDTVVVGTVAGAAADVDGVAGPVCALELAAGTDLALPDDQSLAVTGKALLGAGSSIGRATAGAAGTAPTLEIAGLLELAGDAALDGVGLDLVHGAATTGTLDVKKHRLTVTGPAESRWVDGAVVRETTAEAPGAVELVGDADLDLGGTLAVNNMAAVRLTAPSGSTSPSPTITTPAGTAAIVGDGRLRWDAGTLDGNLRLSVRTSMEGSGLRIISATSTLTNLGLVEVMANTVQTEGTIRNQGELRLFPGARLQSVGSGATPALVNDSGNPASPAILAVGASDSVSASGATMVLDKVSLLNDGVISIVAGARLRLIGPASPTPRTVSVLHPGSRLRDPFPVPASPPSSYVPPPAGRLTVGGGATVKMRGATTLEGRAILELGDAAGAGRLEADPRTGATFAGASAKAGAFHWRDGTVVGPLTTSKITTDVGKNNDTSRRILTNPTNAPSALTLGGPSAVNASYVELAANARVRVTAVTTVASAPGGFKRIGAPDGQSVTVALGGTLFRVASATTPTGSSMTSAPATIDVPVVNHGSVLLQTSLKVPAGYRQSLQPGAPASAAKPITGLFGTSSGMSASLMLSSTDDAGHWAPITIAAGGLGGVGNVEANPLRIGNAWVHPGRSDAAGVMTVEGPLRLSRGSDVQIVVRGTAADKHDQLDVVPLLHNATEVAPGRAYLDGRITGIVGQVKPPTGTTLPKYVPRYLSVVANVLTYASRSGSFASSAWGGTPKGLGWKPRYDDRLAAASTRDTDTDGRAVDLQLVDVMAPALRIGSIPAFTQFDRQRVTFSATDNKTGVHSYDVRWRRASPHQGFGPWRYPSGWQRTTSRAVTKRSLVPGTTYCFSIRARDKARNTTPWSQSLCASRMYDDRAMSASSGWRRPGGQEGWYAETYSLSRRGGAELSKGGTFSRVAVTAYRCPTCGTLDIYAGGTLLKRWRLSSSTSGTVSWVSPTMKLAARRLRLRSDGARRIVVVDAVGMLR